MGAADMGKPPAMTPPDPHATGFDPDRLARIDRFLRERHVDAGRFAGVQLLLSRDGRPVHRAEIGTMRDDGRPMARDTIFRIASMTKPVTSVAFMMLVEEAKVALDTPVADWVPELAGAAPAGGEAGRPMQMIDLLRHTSGLTYGFQRRTPIDAAYRAAGLDDFHADHSLDSMVAALGRLPLEFAPGTLWNYSIATDVLGLVVERIEGRTLDRVFAERILGPLGMADTGFHVPADKADRLADCHALAPDGRRLLWDAGAGSRWLTPPRMLSGGGGLVSTADDYHRFAAMLLGGGALDGVRLLGPRTVALMTANHLPGGGDLAALSRSMFSESANAGTGFGLGVAVNLDPVRTMLAGNAGDYFWGGMFSTFFLVDPAEGLIAILMAQLSPSTSTPVRRELRTMIYAALTESRA